MHWNQVFRARRALLLNPAIALGAVGPAANAAIGTVKVAGKAVGRASDALVDSASPSH